MWIASFPWKRGTKKQEHWWLLEQYYSSSSLSKSSSRRRKSILTAWRSHVAGNVAKNEIISTSASWFHISQQSFNSQRIFSDTSTSTTLHSCRVLLVCQWKYRQKLNQLLLFLLHNFAPSSLVHCVLLPENAISVIVINTGGGRRKERGGQAGKMGMVIKTLTWIPANYFILQWNFTIISHASQ